MVVKAMLPDIFYFFSTVLSTVNIYIVSKILFQNGFAVEYCRNKSFTIIAKFK